MDEMVKELKKLFKFKKTTEVGDIVVIAMENPQSILYALVVGFERDTVKKQEWWHVTLQLLTVPPQKVTWTLRTPQFTGQEIFSMGGDKRYIKAVDFSGASGPFPTSEDSDRDTDGAKTKLRVVK